MMPLLLLNCQPGLLKSFGYAVQPDEKKNRIKMSSEQSKVVAWHSNLSDSAERLLEFFVAHYIQTSLAGLYYDIFELANKAGLDPIDCKEAVRELANGGILTYYRRNNYIFLRKQYLQEQGLISRATTNTTERHASMRQMQETRLGGRVIDVAKTQELPDLKVHPPARIHRIVRRLFKAKQVLSATETARLWEACDIKHEKNWSTGRLTNLTYCINPMSGVLKFYIKDADSIAQAGEEFSRFCSQLGFKFSGDFGADCLTETEVGFNVSGDVKKYDHVKAHLEIRDTKVSFWFDKSHGSPELDARVTAYGSPQEAAQFAEYIIVGTLSQEIKQQLDRIEKQTRKKRRKPYTKSGKSLRSEILELKALLRGKILTKIDKVLKGDKDRKEPPIEKLPDRRRKNRWTST
jgi:hypothetical protein